MDWFQGNSHESPVFHGNHGKSNGNPWFPIGFPFNSAVQGNAAPENFHLIPQSTQEKLLSSTDLNWFNWPWISLDIPGLVDSWDSYCMKRDGTLGTWSRCKLTLKCSTVALSNHAVPLPPLTTSFQASSVIPFVLNLRVNQIPKVRSPAQPLVIASWLAKCQGDPRGWNDHGLWSSSQLIHFFEFQQIYPRFDEVVQALFGATTRTLALSFLHGSCKYCMHAILTRSV